MTTVTAEAPVRTCDCGGWTDTWFARHGAVFNVAVNPGVRVVVRAAPAPSGPARARRHPRGELRRPLRLPARHPAVGAPRAARGRRRIGGRAARSGASTCPCGRPSRRARRPARRRPCAWRWSARSGRCGTGRGPGRCREGRACRGGRPAGPAVRSAGSDRRRAWRHQLRRDHRVPGGHAARRGGIRCGARRPRAAVAARVPGPHAQFVGDSPGGDPRPGPARDPAAAPRSTTCARPRPPRARAVEAGDLAALGAAMHANTEGQRRLHPSLVSTDAQRVIAAVAARGALGWKVNGAGGEGGSLAVLCPPGAPERAAIEAAIAQASPASRVLPTTIAPPGSTLDRRESSRAGAP